jgi:hypothetical protein
LKYLGILLLFVHLAYSQSKVEYKECDCSSKSFKGDSLIFYGKVLDVTTNNVTTGIKATVGVSRIFKGKTDPVTVVSSEYPGLGCGFPFEKDSFYLIYAYKSRSIRTSICQATQKIPLGTNLSADLGKGFAATRDIDKIYAGIIRMSLATLGGFLLLLGILFFRKRARKSIKGE